MIIYCRCGKEHTLEQWRRCETLRAKTSLKRSALAPVEDRQLKLDFGETKEAHEETKILV